MAKAGRKPEHTDEELAVEALKLQTKYPLMSEGAICSKLFSGHGRKYLASRAKKSERIQEVRQLMAAQRQFAWEKHGQELIDGSNSSKSGPTLFIWMTRNILGWRDEKRVHKDAHKVGAPNERDEKLKALLSQIKEFVANKGEPNA